MKRTVLKLTNNYTCKGKLQGRNPKSNDKHLNYNPITWIILLINNYTNINCLQSIKDKWKDKCNVTIGNFHNTPVTLIKTNLTSNKPY